MSAWIDITRPVDEKLITWPSQKRPSHRWDKRIASGHHCNTSFWQLSAHSGTHMDAPLHFVDGGKAIDQISPEVFIGPCQVIDLASASLDAVTELMALAHAGVQRLLVKTSHSRLRDDGAYDPHEALMTEKTASLLLQNGLTLLGTDRLSVDDGQGRSFGLHHLLLGSGCVIIEGLLLSDIQEGAYDLSAAPLRLTGTEASPVRALLKKSGAGHDL